MILTHEKLVEAMQWASRMHMPQTRWLPNQEKEPYFNHLLRVWENVKLYHGSIEAQIAAVLHDIVEDADVTIEEVEARFGSEVASYVRQLTLPKDLNGYYHKLHVQLDAMKRASSDEVRLIKVADKLDNAGRLDMVPWLREAKLGYYIAADLVIEQAVKSVNRSSALINFVNDVVDPRLSTVHIHIEMLYGEDEFAQAYYDWVAGYEDWERKQWSGLV